MKYKGLFLISTIQILSISTFSIPITFNSLNPISLIQEKSNTLFNFTSALKTLISNSEKNAPQKMVTSQKKSLRNSKKSESKKSGLNHMINKLSKSIFTKTTLLNDEKSILMPKIPLALFSKSPTIKPNIAFCLQMNLKNQKKLVSMMYNFHFNDFILGSGKCNTQDLFIPRTVKGNQKVFHLISARNGMALMQNQKDEIQFAKREFVDEQFWVFIQEKGERFRIYNLKSRKMIGHNGKGFLKMMEQGGNNDLEKVFTVNQREC
jgi:hypothetical protein